MDGCYSSDESERLVALTACLFAPNRLQMDSYSSARLFVRMCLCPSAHDRKEEFVLNGLVKSKITVTAWKEITVRHHVETSRPVIYLRITQRKFWNHSLNLIWGKKNPELDQN